MSNCPCCHGTQFEVNPLDEALCCVDCGTVAEEAQLRTESGTHYAPPRMQTTHESDTTKAWLQRFAIYFDGTDETYHEALQWYKAHLNYCPRKFTKELALYIIYIIKKPLCAGIELDNMMMQCPDTIDEHRLRLVHSRLSTLVPYTPMDWKVYMLSHFSNIYTHVSKNMMRQKKMKKIKKVILDEKDVRSMAIQLLSIFQECDGGYGKQKRPLMVAAITISYLYYYQKRVKGAKHLTIQQTFDIRKLANELDCGYRTILKYLNDLQHFILACIKSTPGTHKEIKVKDAYLFLNLMGYIKPKNSTKSSAFPLQQETVHSFIRAQEESHRLASALERAKTGHLDDFEDDTLEFYMRFLMDKGVDVVNRSEVQLRQMCSVYYYRSMVNSTTVDDIPDMDQHELTQYDMSEAELAGYLEA